MVISNIYLLIMQSLREKIKLTLDQNLKSRDEIATSTVRLILAAIKDHDIQYRTKTVSYTHLRAHETS